ncbi:triosephosphate isomerase [Pseudarcicella hirudinis]|uniref:Triosephosphate isomerase n=1 Tax=Pseudarcicella hirudinis TaxID=1079859 RepID=A0A1I5XCA8_9BACT|nr:triose-phosphate isomerase [Pseudarcicella hirudinis]SFQ29504.1 triosephosphate isomerase [Pseudarcicella hirudinis]
MRKKIVAGNWKMNKTIEEALALVSEVANMVKDEVSTDVQVVVAPPALYLSTLQKYTEAVPNLGVSAQNCHQKASGAYTGEVSAAMLKSIAVEYVILGHSERRQYFGETNEQLAEKVNIALENGLTPIFCCGESLEQRNGGNFLEFVSSQLTESLFHLSPEDFAKVVIAYEPIWAIGTGLTASSEQAQEMHAHLRKHLAAKYGQEAADNTSILYGGSCNEKNAPELFACPDVDGGLIGGASLKSREFVNIAKSF